MVFPDRMRKMKRKALLIFCLVLIVIGASWSLFRPGMFKIHDFIHGVRVTEMHRALSEGQIPVRWTEHFGYGYGMPLFEFYAPLPYYVGALLYGIGIPLVIAVKILFLLSTVGTAIGAYFLGKELFSHKSAGILVAAAYTLAPYRALNLFVRGALSEAWGMMALPWIMYGILVARKKIWLGFYFVVFGCVVLLLSHNLTALIVAPFLILFTLGVILVEALRGASVLSLLKYLAILFGSVLLSLGLTAFYVIPAFLEKQYTQIESTILSGYFDFSLHFLYIRQFFSSSWGFGGSEWGPEDPISFYLGTGQWIAVAVAGASVGWTLVNSIKKRTFFKVVISRNILLSVLIVLITLGGLYMSLQRSIGIWRAIEPLSYIQFPWRYLSVASLGMALTVGIPLLFTKGRAARVYIVGMFCVVLFSSVGYFRPESYYDDASGLYYDNPARVASHMSEILPDYIPVGVEIEDISPPEEPFWFEDEYVPEKVTETLVKRGHERLYRFNRPLTQTVEMSFAIADFPGWTVYADGIAVGHTQSKRGYISAYIPLGTELVGVQFKGTPVRNASDLVSFASVVLFVCLVFVHQRHSFFRKGIV